jgi:hypothetical protein
MNPASRVIGESRKHKAAKLLHQIPGIDPIRAARMLALMQCHSASAANGNSGPIMGWALRPATVRSVATCADNCNVGKNRNRFVG